MTAESFPILTSEGAVINYRLDPAILRSFVPLPVQHEKYFAVGPGTKYVPVADLIFSRARPEGIAHANVLMQEAAVGRVDRRNPISVRILENKRFQVVDGNSTAINALLSGWYDIPADIQAGS
jgi:hypothetical protein